MFGLPSENRHGYEVGLVGDVVCDVHYGTSKKASDDGKYTYLRMNNITFGGELDLTDTKRINVSDKDLAGCAVKRGDVLFNRTNSRDLVGKTCVFNLDEPMVIAGYIIRLRMNGCVIPEYLSTFLNLDSSKKMLYSMAKGAVGQANINAQEVQAIELVIPPREAQLPFKSIVEQSDKSKFTGFKSQFIEMFGLPSENRHGYEVGLVGDVVCDVHYGTSKKASDDGKYTYLRMNNITFGGELDLTDTKRINVSDKDLAGCAVKRGDVLFNRTNSRDLVGKTCVFNLDEPMVIAGYIIRLRMNGCVIPEYLSTFLNLDSSKKMLYSMAKGAVGQANINAQEVQAIELVIPPREAQLPFKSIVEQSDKSK